MLAKINSLSNSQLSELLENSYPYIGFEELRAIPMAVMCHLHSIPTALLKSLKDHLQVLDIDIPVQIMQQVWQFDLDTFTQALLPIVRAYMLDQMAAWSLEPERDEINMQSLSVNIKSWTEKNLSLPLYDLTRSIKITNPSEITQSLIKMHADTIQFLQYQQHFSPAECNIEDPGPVPAENSGLASKNHFPFLTNSKAAINIFHSQVKFIDSKKNLHLQLLADYIGNQVNLYRAILSLIKKIHGELIIWLEYAEKSARSNNNNNNFCNKETSKQEFDSNLKLPLLEKMEFLNAYCIRDFGLINNLFFAISSLRFNLIMTLHERSQLSICNEDPIYQFCWCLSSCIQDHSFDERRLAQMEFLIESIQNKLVKPIIKAIEPNLELLKPSKSQKSTRKTISDSSEPKSESKAKPKKEYTAKIKLKPTKESCSPSNSISNDLGAAEITKNEVDDGAAGSNMNLRKRNYVEFREKFIKNEDERNLSEDISSGAENLDSRNEELETNKERAKKGRLRKKSESGNKQRNSKNKKMKQLDDDFSLEEDDIDDYSDDSLLIDDDDDAEFTEESEEEIDDDIIDMEDGEYKKRKNRKSADSSKRKSSGKNLKNDMNWIKEPKKVQESLFANSFVNLKTQNTTTTTSSGVTPAIRLKKGSQVLVDTIGDNENLGNGSWAQGLKIPVLTMEMLKASELLSDVSMVMRSNLSLLTIFQEILQCLEIHVQSLINSGIRLAYQHREEMMQKRKQDGLPPLPYSPYRTVYTYPQHFEFSEESVQIKLESDRKLIQLLSWTELIYGPKNFSGVSLVSWLATHHLPPKLASKDLVSNLLVKFVLVFVQTQRLWLHRIQVLKNLAENHPRATLLQGVGEEPLPDDIEESCLGIELDNQYLNRTFNTFLENEQITFVQPNIVCSIIIFWFLNRIGLADPYVTHQVSNWLKLSSIWNEFDENNNNNNNNNNDKNKVNSNANNREDTESDYNKKEKYENTTNDKNDSGNYEDKNSDQNIKDSNANRYSIMYWKNEVLNHLEKYPEWIKEILNGLAINTFSDVLELRPFIVDSLFVPLSENSQFIHFQVILYLNLARVKQTISFHDSLNILETLLSQRNAAIWYQKVPYIRRAYNILNNHFADTCPHYYSNKLTTLWMNFQSNLPSLDE